MKNSQTFVITFFSQIQQLNGKFATNSEDSSFRLPFMYTAVQLEQFEIDTQQEKLLFVKLFTIDTKVSSSRIFMSFRSTIFFNFFLPK